MNPKLNLIEKIEQLSGNYAAARKQLEGHQQYQRLNEITQKELPADLAQMIQQYETARKGLEGEKIVIPSLVKLKEPTSTRVKEGTYENIDGNLRDAYKNTVFGTMLHAAEITKARITDHSLRTVGFYTADGPLYFLKEGKPLLALTREKENLVLRHIDAAFEQLVHGDGNYYPDAEEARKAIAAPETVIIDISELRLKKYDDEFSYLEINTQDYSRFNAEERKLAKRYFGEGEDFVASMQMLADANIKNTGVYILNPTYVQKHAKKSTVWRASWLANFDYDSGACAVDRSIDSHYRLRGVRG